MNLLNLSLFLRFITEHKHHVSIAVQWPLVSSWMHKKYTPTTTTKHDNDGWWLGEHKTKLIIPNTCGVIPGSSIRAAVHPLRIYSETIIGFACL